MKKAAIDETITACFKDLYYFFKESLISAKSLSVEDGSAGGAGGSSFFILASATK